MKKYCAINIGSNSSKMLIANCLEHVLVEEVEINKLTSGLFVTGLGKEVYKTGKLTDQGIRSTVEALRVFKAKADELEVDDIWVTATAAGRVADNSDELEKRIYEETGLKLEIISYSKEAELAFKGMWGSNIINGMKPEDVIVLDSGGASTEFIRLDNRDDDVSDNIIVGTLKIGALTLTNDFLISDPPSREEINRMLSHIDELLYFIKGDLGITSTKKLIAIGGAITSMAMIKLGPGRTYEDVHGMHISVDYAESVLERLCNISSEEIKNISGMPKDRAHTILAGIAILCRCMRGLEVEEITISSSGILEGMIMDMAQIKTS